MNKWLHSSYQQVETLMFNKDTESSPLLCTLFSYRVDSRDSWWQICYFVFFSRRLAPCPPQLSSLAVQIPARPYTPCYPNPIPHVTPTLYPMLPRPYTPCYPNPIPHVTRLSPFFFFFWGDSLGPRLGNGGEQSFLAMEDREDSMAGCYVI